MYQGYHVPGMVYVNLPMVHSQAQLPHIAITTLSDTVDIPTTQLQLPHIAIITLSDTVDIPIHHYPLHVFSELLWRRTTNPLVTPIHSTTTALSCFHFTTLKNPFKLLPITTPGVPLLILITTSAISLPCVGSGNPLASCPISNVYCSARCRCVDGYGGMDCSLDAAALVDRWTTSEPFLSRPFRLVNQLHIRTSHPF